MAQQLVVTKYVSTDGTEFNSEAEADSHDMAVGMLSQINEFVEGANIGTAHAGFLREILPAWQVFRETGKVAARPVKAKVERDPNAPKGKPGRPSKADLAARAAAAGATPAGEGGGFDPEGSDA